MNVLIGVIIGLFINLAVIKPIERMHDHKICIKEGLVPKEEDNATD